MGGLDFTWLFIKMLSALVVVCISAVLLLRYGVPKLTQWRSGEKKSPFQLLARFGLENRRTLYLMRIFDKHFVLGASEGGITKLAEVSEEEIKGLKDA